MHTKKIFWILLASFTFTSLQSNNYDKGWWAGYDFHKQYYSSDHFWDGFTIGAFGAAYIGLIIGTILFDNTTDKYAKEKRDAKTALEMYKVIDGELNELKKVCNKEVSFKHSTLRNYLGNVDVMHISHLEKTGFYQAIDRDKKLYAQAIEILQTIKQIANQLSIEAECILLKKELYQQVKAIYATINKNILKAETALNKKITSMITFDDSMVQFLLA